ncbi:hypothetical protein [Sanguibacter suaedae]|uniref:Uncharacterized protein n=1 Tax=Sanguibacter suaedae TaxID=2795737 RepID=A0A934MBN0_9MICO|nr:hypothetical protein [Sanguibacter suaedae]MBI9115496.1 hypothetical protein [Sanguibacter suaedae]
MTDRAAAVVVSPSLVPGATGRADLRAGRRTAVCAVLASAVAGGLGTARPPEQVVVVAPTRRWRGRTTDAGPDVGALGLPVPGADLDPSPDREPLLDVTASVASVLLRESGWHGPVTTVEVSSHEGPAVQDVLDTLTGHLGAGHVVVVASASPDGRLGEGAPTALREAEQIVHDIARALIPPGCPTGPRGTRRPAGS